MSRGSELRYARKAKYFDALQETAQKVDPYVRTFLEKSFTLVPDFRELLLNRYRFGKQQLRPALVRFSYELAGGQDWTITIPACAAMEVRDTGYYCLDDVLDLGAEQGLVLTGASLLSVSYGMLCDLSTSVPYDVFVKILNESYRLDQYNAQGAFVETRIHRTSEAQYMLKAEGYNFFEHALLIGGLLAQCQPELLQILGCIGKKIGMAYIIANDTWDFGKNLEDFRQEKYTLPLIFALQHASEENQQILTTLFGKSDLSAPEKERAQMIMIRCGAIDFGKKRAWALCEEALTLLLKHFEDSRARQFFEFATTTTQRNRYFTELQTVEGKI